MNGGISMGTPLRRLKERKRVVFKLVIDVRADVEGRAGVLSDDELVALARRPERAEVDVVRNLAGRLVLTEGLALARRNGLAGRVDNLPVEGGLSVRLDGGNLVVLRQVANLVNPHLFKRLGRETTWRDFELRIIQLDIVETNLERSFAGERTARNRR